MKNDQPKNTSQDYDRKHGHDHVANNPRAAKDQPSWEDTAAVMPKGHHEDKREEARHEHTNHFTNRASGDKK